MSKMSGSSELALVETYTTAELLDALEQGAPFPFADPNTIYTEQVQGFSDVFAITPPPATDRPTLIALAGPSGSGKDAVLHEIEEHGAPYAKVRSATTRPRRPGEPFDAYVWMEQDISVIGGLGKLAAEYGLVECQEHSGACYGIPLSSLEEAHDANPDLPMLVKSDPGGVRMLRESIGDQMDVICIGLIPQSYAQVWGRMQNRNAKLQRIIDAAKYATEIGHIANFIVRNAERETPAEGIRSTAEQLTRLIRLM